MHIFGYAIYATLVLLLSHFAHANEKETFVPVAMKSRAFIAEQYLEIYLIGESNALRLIAPYPINPQDKNITYGIADEKVSATYYRGNNLEEDLISPVPLFPKDRYEAVSGIIHLDNIPIPELISGVWEEKLVIGITELDFQSIMLQDIEQIKVMVSHPMP